MGGKADGLALLQRRLRVPPFKVFSYEIGHELTREDRAALISAFEQLNTGRVAVRSSGQREDGVNAAYAGVFETKLYVRREDLIEAVEDVLESARSARVEAYESALDLRGIADGMSVIIQRMVNSRVSGVCVTHIEPRGGSTVVEACLGLGEALVAGLVDPDRYILNGHQVEEISVGYQARRLVGKEDWPRAQWEPVPFHQRSARKLTNEELLAVVTGSFEAEELLGVESADVEWAFEGSELYFLQCRPYTPVIHKLS